MKQTRSTSFSQVNPERRLLRSCQGTSHPCTLVQPAPSAQPVVNFEICYTCSILKSYFAPLLAIPRLLSPFPCFPRLPANTHSSFAPTRPLPFSTALSCLLDSFSYACICRRAAVWMRCNTIDNLPHCRQYVVPDSHPSSHTPPPFNCHLSIQSCHYLVHSPYSSYSSPFSCSPTSNALHPTPTRHSPSHTLFLPHRCLLPDDTSNPKNSCASSSLPPSPILPLNPPPPSRFTRVSPQPWLTCSPSNATRVYVFCTMTPRFSRFPCRELPSCLHLVPTASC